MTALGGGATPSEDVQSDAVEAASAHGLVRARHLGRTLRRTLRLTLAYDGTGLHGWQYQPNLPTIQGLVIDACARILGEPVKVVGASRTDAGVHALGQVASVSSSSTITTAAFGRALNALLPSAISVIDVSEAPSGFDARRSATGKRYAYVIDRGRVADPFVRRFAWHPGFDLDVDAMRAAAAMVRGKHDFSSFCAAAGRGRTPVCTVRSCRIATRRQRLAIMISADSFLHHMVRNLVGTLAEIGRGARRPEDIAAVLAGHDRRLAGPTAPAHGLVLVRVLYRDR